MDGHNPRLGDIEDTRDLPDDLTPFITRTTMNPISGGAFGDVWKCNYHAADGISTFVAVKAFRFPEDCDLQRMKRQIRREIGILKILRHNNIVPLLGTAKGFGQLPEMDCLVSPWMQNGTLRTYLESRHNNLTVPERSRLLEDVSAGLCYLHSIPVMHGNITGENILIDNGGNARLIDFGLSSFIQPPLSQFHLATTSTRHGAIRYAAPELLTSDDFRDLPSEKVDIYSFGCVMLQILLGRPPWSEIQSEYHIIFSISRGRGPQRPNGDPSIIDSDWDFIQKCLGHKPELRPSADEVFDFVIHRLSSSRSSEQAVELHPTTDKIFQICPRFRILVMGKTGVGKSSLINHAFGVQETLASNVQPGQADIEKEYISPQNDKFVLHDSKGFEPGEKDNVNIVKEFIQRRRRMESLGDMLHAVWLCFEIPRAGGRILETGTEDFLRLKRDGALGKIPVVAVLTKYDKFMDHVERMLNDNDLDDLSDDDVKDVIKRKSDNKLRDICAPSLKKLAGSDIPYATVSTKENHKDMIARLIQITEERVRQHVATEASVMTSTAQRVDPKLNITTSIEVGKREYWKALASTAAFRGRTAWDCLEVLHTDIVRVWNFLDPHRYLDSKEFKMLMVNVVDKMDVGSIAKPNRTMAFGLSTAVGAIGGIMSVLLGPAAPIVVQIMAPVVIGKWVYDVYQPSRVVLQHFIAYIVDLTLILQTLYLLSDSQELSRRAIKLVVASYLESRTSTDVHSRIQEYDLPLSESADDDTLNKIVELMELLSMEAKDIRGLRAHIPPFAPGEDEEW